MGERCECGYYDWERPHSRPGGGVCTYAYARRTGSMTEFNRDNSATIDRLIRERDEALQMAANQAATIKTQIEEIERLREDAERYRWLKRQASTVDYDTRVNVIDDILAQYGERWDALIDAAMRKGK